MTKPVNRPHLKTGRPSSFKQEYIEQAYKLALLKCTEDEISDIFQVSRETLHEWKKGRPLFADAIARGKIQADANMALSLYHRGIGYDRDGKHYPGDVNAASLWLRNRQSSKWRDRVEHTGADGDAITINLVKFSERAEPVTIEHKPDDGK